MVIILTLQSDFHSLYDCLHEYIEKNLLDRENTWTCDTCKENNCPSQKKIFWKLSPIIILGPIWTPSPITQFSPITTPLLMWEKAHIFVFFPILMSLSIMEVGC